MGAEAAGQATTAGNGRMMRQRWAAWRGDERAGEIRQPAARWMLLYCGVEQCTDGVVWCGVCASEGGLRACECGEESGFVRRAVVVGEEERDTGRTAS